MLDDGGGALAASGAPKLKHRKKKTDNRRSKGRRLSYEPMPKLQNFMFPEIPERPIVLSELFGSVFGARIAPDGGADAAAAAAPAVDDGPALGGVAPLRRRRGKRPAPASAPAPAPRRRRTKKAT